MARKKKAKNISGDYTAEQIVAQANEMFGAGSLTLCRGGPILDVPTISTGSPSVDIALGIGGLPYGRIVEIYGPESSGKTTLCQHVVANVQKAGGICAFIDTEHALDPTYAESIGVDVDSLLLSQPDCGEDALRLAEMMIRTGSVNCIIIDSVTNLVPRAEIEGEMGDSHMGLQARLMSQALRKLTGITKKNNVLLIFTNQIRMKIGVMFGSPETTSGGRALKFYASIRMDIRRTGGVKSGDDVIGSAVRIKVVKNKLAPPFRIAETRIMYDGKGIDYLFDIMNQAIKAGYITKKGSWFAYDGENIGQGADAVIEWLRENPELTESLYDAVVNPEEEEEEVTLEEQLADAREEKGLHERGTPEYKEVVKLIKKLKEEMKDG